MCVSIKRKKNCHKQIKFSAKDLKDLGENERGNKMGTRLIIMKKVEWALIEFADLHGERHAQRHAEIYFCASIMQWATEL
jgi:hypothetical protein